VIDIQREFDIAQLHCDQVIEHGVRTAGGGIAYGDATMRWVR
jgi:hypothetical protein